MNSTAHSAFLDHICQHLEELARQPEAATRIRNRADEILVVAMLDLEPLRDELTVCYAGRRGGRPPRDPVCMLRAVIVLTMLVGLAVDTWIEHLEEHPEVDDFSCESRAEVPVRVNTTSTV